MRSLACLWASVKDTPIPLTSGVGFSLADGVGRAKGVNDGDGFLFVSHTGEIFPSGFLPVSGGNVRTHDLVEVYRCSDLFRSLRNRSLLKGKCGVCEYREVCGGSRARAYALTGDYLEAEPFCTHVPKKYQSMVERGEAEPVEQYFARRTWQPGAPPPAALVRAIKTRLVQLRPNASASQPGRPPDAGADRELQTWGTANELQSLAVRESARGVRAG